jgi:hypothetical protein
LTVRELGAQFRYLLGPEGILNSTSADISARKEEWGVGRGRKT